MECSTSSPPGDVTYRKLEKVLDFHLPWLVHIQRSTLKWSYKMITQTQAEQDWEVQAYLADLDASDSDLESEPEHRIGGSHAHHNEVSCSHSEHVRHPHRSKTLRRLSHSSFPQLRGIPTESPITSRSSTIDSERGLNSPKSFAATSRSCTTTTSSSHSLVDHPDPQIQVTTLLSLPSPMSLHGTSLHHHLLSLRLSPEEAQRGIRSITVTLKCFSKQLFSTVMGRPVVMEMEPRGERHKEMDGAEIGGTPHSRVASALPRPNLNPLPPPSPSSPYPPPTPISPSQRNPSRNQFNFTISSFLSASLSSNNSSDASFIPDLPGFAPQLSRKAKARIARFDPVTPPENCSIRVKKTEGEGEGEVKWFLHVNEEEDEQALQQQQSLQMWPTSSSPNDVEELAVQDDDDEQIEDRPRAMESMSLSHHSTSSGASGESRASSPSTTEEETINPLTQPRDVDFPFAVWVHHDGGGFHEEIEVSVQFNTTVNRSRGRNSSLSGKANGKKSFGSSSTESGGKGGFLKRLHRPSFGKATVPTFEGTNG